MCLQALIRSSASNEVNPFPQSIDLELCLCCFNYDYNFPSCILLMSSKWKCLSQEEVPFLSLVSGDMLNILIDVKLIFRRQENPEAFVTLTAVARVIRRPVKAGLGTGYSHFPTSLGCGAWHTLAVNMPMAKSFFLSLWTY